MSAYRLEGVAAVLTTVAPDEGRTWNGFAVPRATFAELLAFSDAALTEGARWVLRPVLIDGELLALMFPCDGECDQVSSGDFWPLGNDEHAHHDEAFEYFVAGENDPVHVDGITWERAER